MASYPPIYAQQYPQPAQQGGGYFGNALLESFAKQQELAQKEIENRYLEALKGRQELRDRTLGQLAGWGESMKNDVNHNYSQNLREHEIGGKNLLGDMASRGLNGSSIRASVKNSQDYGRANIERNKQGELTRVGDAVIGRQTAADASLSDAIYQMMERRNDIQPDWNQLASIYQKLGQAGIGIGGGGSGGGFFGAPPYAAPTPPGQTPIAQPWKINVPKGLDRMTYNV